MNRLPFHAAFAVGLAALAWVAAGYIPGHLLALTLVGLIAAFYLLGALELHRFQRDTAGLSRALAATTETPAAIGPWLAALPAPLQHAVRLRVEGERVALPGPALTPYLAGLLVLLGMLGTFLGMVVTLNGTGLALEHAANVDAIRASLAAPVKGLGLAFGTSVAGVAASAMLGLMSALARRERQQAGRRLDAAIATTLRRFSRTQQREDSLQALQSQAAVMAELMTGVVPQLMNQMQGLVAQLERQGQSLHDGLLASQERFQGETQRAYSGLAASVDQSLKATLSDSARLVGAAIEPAVQSTMAGLAREATALQQTLSSAVHGQLDGVSARLQASTDTLAERWQAALEHQRQHSAATAQSLEASLGRHAQTFEQRAAALVDAVALQLGQHTGQWATSWNQALAEQQQAQQALTAQATADMAQRQQQICTTLEQTAQNLGAQSEAHARATIGEIARLVQAASEAPRAAAEVIGELRSALSDSLVRDNAVLDERNRLMATLGGLLDAVQHAGSEQRRAIDGLVQATHEVLDRAGSRFADTVEAESRTMRDVSAQVAASAAEMASLGEGFGAAVQLFGSASEQLTSQLMRIETALGQSMARSDEQLAYYVAQAREIIDLTLGSQKQIVDDLQQLARAQSPSRPSVTAATAGLPAPGSTVAVSRPGAAATPAEVPAA